MMADERRNRGQGNSPDLDPDFTPTENVEQDHRGSVMFEYESYERVVEGLKLASDGARNMARFAHPDRWNVLAQFLDSARKAIVQLAGTGMDRGTDTKESDQLFGGSGLSRVASMSRVTNGLRDASAGANQIAQAQRLDVRWLQYATKFSDLRDKAYALASLGSPIKVKSNWTPTTALLH
jgi:hypothetical protein